jgi:energy-coupling factor transport system permease protein
MKHTWAWVSWLVAALAVLTLTRNPLYLILALLCIVFVALTFRQAGAVSPRPFSLWKFAVFVILLATAFNALTSHYGETVLFTIPGKVPLLSGHVTLEALVYGTTNGLVLTGMLASFVVLNLALPVRALISLIPRAFYPVAVVTSIAVTYVPTTLRQFQNIREAQAVRGHQVRTLRDWLPLLMPLLVGGLEHAMQLAEAMTARGFASPITMTGAVKSYQRIVMLLGLAMLAGGWVLKLAVKGGTGWVLISLGALLIIWGLWLLGRQTPRTSYHRLSWHWQDTLALCGALIVLAACLLPLPGLGRERLYYSPYPILSVPAFDPWLGLALLGLLVPGLLKQSQGSERTE